MQHLVAVCLFLSGAAALIYQILWIRVLTVSLGVTVQAVSTVLTVFMLGLAIGSVLFGRWSSRTRQPLRMLALLEAGIALAALGFVFAAPRLPAVVAAWRTGSESESVLFNLVALAVGSLLLPAAVLMGGTLPVVSRWAAQQPLEVRHLVIKCYGWNTLGAVIGCLLSIVLIPTIGVRWATCLAMAMNLLAGLTAMLLQRRNLGQDTAETIASASSTLAATPSRPPGSAMFGVAFASGFVVLAAEVLWTRLMINLMSANVVVYGMLLAGVLAGLATASWLIARIGRHLRLPRASIILMLLAAAVCLAAYGLGQDLMAGFLRLSFSFRLFGDPILPNLLAIFLLMLFSALLLGLVFPALLLFIREPLRAPVAVGHLYAANTVGAIAGSLVAGFLLLRWCGLNASFLLLAALLLAVAALLARSFTRYALTIGTITLVVLAAIPTVRQPYYWFNAGFREIRRIPAAESVFLNEGLESTVGVWNARGTLSLTVNGLIVADNSRTDLWDLLLKAHLPMLLHDHPRDVCLVGLGAGASLGAVLSHAQPQRVDCAELSAAVVEAHRYFGITNQKCWTDPRLRLHVNDGRHFLLTTERRFDVLSVDPVDPPVCNLYSQDFFQLCHDRLAEGGIMVQWLPLFRLSTADLRTITRGFINVFPHATMWFDGTALLLIAQRDAPLRIDVPRFRQRWSADSVQRNLKLIHSPSAELLLGTCLCGPRGVQEFAGAGPANTDDLPHLEYGVLWRARGLIKKDIAANLTTVEQHIEPLDALIDNSQLPPAEWRRLERSRALLIEILRIRRRLLLGERREALDGLAELLKRYQINRTGFALLQPLLGDVEYDNLQR